MKYVVILIADYMYPAKSVPFDNRRDAQDFYDTMCHSHLHVHVRIDFIPEVFFYDPNVSTERVSIRRWNSSDF